MAKTITEMKQKKTTKKEKKYPVITLDTDLSFEELIKESLKPKNSKTKVKKKKK